MRRSTSWSRASSGELIVLVVLLAGCVTREARAPSSAKPVTLFFTSEVRGYIGPCGCSENMRGGVSRAAFQVAEARKTGGPAHLVDCGDGLFGDAVIPEEAVAQQERKAKALADAWKAMGLTLRTAGPLDDARGVPFHEALGLPELKSGTFKVLDGVAIVSAPTLAAAAALVPQATKEGARFVVAVVPAPYEQLLREAMDVRGIGLVVSSKSRDAFAAEQNRLAGGVTKVAQVQSKGRSLLKVSVNLRTDGGVEWLRGDGERDRELYALDERVELVRGQVNEPMLSDEMKALRKAKLEELIARREALAATPVVVPNDRSTVTARFVPLESTFPKDPAVQVFEKAYDVDVGLLNLAYAKEKGVSCPPATEEKPGFVGTAACAKCHGDAETVWKTTRHPRAYASLQVVGKENHLDCVGCHVTGWKQPQGVCRIDETEGRREVSCESCHGPGSAHVVAPLKTGVLKKPDASTCVVCHDRENSPQFDFDAYRAKIVGKGHGG